METSSHFRKIENLDEIDPVIKKWNMYMNVCPETHVMLLRYPEKMPGQLRDKTNGKPLEMRIKPQCGLVEVDIPIDPYATEYDKLRGIIYGEAMRKSKVLKEKGGAYGVAGGLAASSAVRTRSRIGQPAEEDELTNEDLLEDYDYAVEHGHVMNKMTLGGHINLWQEGNPNLFVAAFKGKDAYFTKVNALCVLRPQLVHIDALNDQKRSTIRMQPGVDTEENEAVSVNMTIKKSEGESLDSANEDAEIAKVLKAMRREPWQHLSWVDSDSQEAWEKYGQTFIPSNKASLPQLACNITNEQWLETISCPRLDPINPRKRSMATRAGDEDLSSTDSEVEEGDDAALGKNAAEASAEHRQAAGEAS